MAWYAAGLLLALVAFLIGGTVLSAWNTRRCRHDWQPIYGVMNDARCRKCGKERP